METQILYRFERTSSVGVVVSEMWW